MMAKTVEAKKKLDEKYLAKRREQKKMSMRRARQKIKNDPVKHEEVKLKRRQNYQELKQQGKIKSISEFSSREQRKIRKEWKTRSQNYRTRQQNIEKEQEFVDSFTPPESPFAMNVEVFELPITSRQKDSGKKLARHNRDKKNKIIKEMEKKLKKAQQKLLKYKSRVARLKKKYLRRSNSDDTPQKVVDNLLKGQNVSQEVRKKLLFGVAISNNMFGTMKVHQLTWDKEKPLVIQTRRLSCLKCSSSKSCLHFDLGVIQLMKTKNQEANQSYKRIHYNDVYSDDSDAENENNNSIQKKTAPSLKANVNDYVLVKFQGKTKNTKYYYIGTVIKKFDDELLIKFMKKSGKKFVWPEVEDISLIDSKDVIAILEQPNINNRQQYEFFLNETYQSFLA